MVAKLEMVDPQSIHSMEAELAAKLPDERFYLGTFPLAFTPNELARHWPINRNIVFRVPTDA